MLQYLQVTQDGRLGPNGEKIERLDQFDCRSRGLLNKISNKLVRDVSRNVYDVQKFHWSGHYIC
jgi:hypothetical protein